MRFFLSSIFITILSLICGHYAMFVVPHHAHKKPYQYSKQDTSILLSIQKDIKTNKQKALQEASTLALSSKDIHAVSKAYFLRSQINFLQNNIHDAKKDLAYAKEIEFDTFSKTAKYPFIKSLRSLAQYESQLNSGYKKSYIQDLVPTFYYLLGMFVFIVIVTLIKLGLFKKNKEITWN